MTPKPGHRGIRATHLLRGFVVTALCLGFILILGSALVEGARPGSQRAAPPEPPQAPTLDRLAEPLLGEAPTQVETGRSLYYFNCMPCHGDHGQGLTDEWRLVWVEDHQNCWARGCHTGKAELSSFYIPRVVPPVTGLSHFPTDEALFDFLRATQPPQRPGALSDSEYWALTAFLLYKDGRLPPEVEIGSAVPVRAVAHAEVLKAMLAILLALFVTPRSGRQ